jgi:hypothetical protein
MRFPIFLLITLLLLGCSRSAPKSTERLSSPPQGYARLIPARVSETPERIHYQWSLLGERNWTVARVEGGRASLADVYKLNDPKRSGGCHTWLCDVILQKQGEQWQWELRLHGSNGKTATQSGSASGTPEVLVPKDQDAKLPAEVALARVGETTLSLSVAQ